MVDMFVVVFIIVGCMIFVFYGDVMNKYVLFGGDTFWYGGVLMLGYFGFDGFTLIF